jgi:hypothetical protein
VDSLSTGCNRLLIFFLETIYSIWQLPPFYNLLPTILMLPDPVLCALPKWRSSDRVRLLSSLCMFQVRPKWPAFGRRPLFLSILPCILFERRSEDFRAIRCEFSFHHFVVLLISVWQDDAGAPLTMTGMLSQRVHACLFFGASAYNHDQTCFDFMRRPPSHNCLSKPLPVSMPKRPTYNHFVRLLPLQ